MERIANTQELATVAFCGSLCASFVETLSIDPNVAVE